MYSSVLSFIVCNFSCKIPIEFATAQPKNLYIFLEKNQRSKASYIFCIYCQENSCLQQKPNSLFWWTYNLLCFVNYLHCLRANTRDLLTCCSWGFGFSNNENIKLNDILWLHIYMLTLPLVNHNSKHRTMQCNSTYK